MQPLEEPLLVLLGQVGHAVVQEIKTASRWSISANINAHLKLQERSSHARAVVAVELALDVKHAAPQASIVQVLAGGRVEVPRARGRRRLA